MPDRRSYPFLDHDGPIPFAHRGGAAGGAENSLAAFQRAYDLGYRYLETDVHATSDGVLLAFHDRTLDRVTDRRGKIAGRPAADVALARIGGREPIPRLDDLLASFPEARVNVDVKDGWALTPLIDVIRRTNAIDRVLVASFSGRRLAAVRAALGPRLATSFAPREALALRLGSHVKTIGPLLPRNVPCVQVPPAVRGLAIVTARFLAAAHAAGLVVHVWTVDDPAVMTRMLDLGVDGIMTDELEVLRDVFRSRGIWPG